jgi:hypothetical protein
MTHELGQAPRVLRPLSLRDYAPEFPEIAFQVWVNPPVELLTRRYEISARADVGRAALVALRKEYPDLKTTERPELAQVRAEIERLVKEQAEAGKALIAWVSEILSAGPEDTRWGEADLQALIAAYGDTDPRVFSWIANSAWEMVLRHRGELKNGSTPPALSSPQAA